MANFDLLVPKMGESISEVTIISWSKKVGDRVEEEEVVLELATDKVDSDLPSPVAGTITEILAAEGDVVQVGQPVAKIALEASVAVSASVATAPVALGNERPVKDKPASGHQVPLREVNGKALSPLVRSIVQEERLGKEELLNIQGTGLQGRITKKDVLAYLESRKEADTLVSKAVHTPQQAVNEKAPPVASGNVEIVEMDRMRSLIAEHMVKSKSTAPHVTSYVEVDVTKMVQWRERVKTAFFERYGQKITYTPIFVEAVVRAIKDFPQINASVSGKQILLKKDINIGIATALPSGNLIVPSIKNADYQNLLGLTKSVNDLVDKARKNQLRPEDITGSTFTISNVGTFRNLMGTPIINQPEVAILATGMIKKRPIVVEAPEGDIIAIRSMMYLSLSYDHRIVDGYLGGSFLAKIGDYLEAFDDSQEI